jgi:hypothetical protein
VLVYIPVVIGRHNTVKTFAVPRSLSPEFCGMHVTHMRLPHRRILIAGTMQLFPVEKKMTEATRLSQTQLSNPQTAKNAHLDASSPGVSWGKNSFRSREDQITFSRWRLGFFVFYSVTALLLGGLAVVSNRSATVAGATAPISQAIASADRIRHR